MVSMCPLLWQRDVKLQQTWEGLYPYPGAPPTTGLLVLLLLIPQSKDYSLLCQEGKGSLITEQPAPMAERSEAQSCSLADDCSSIIVSWETGIESWSGQ